MSEYSLKEVYQGSLNSFFKEASNFEFPFAFKEAGIIARLSNGVAFIRGLSELGLEELVFFPESEERIFGIVFSLESEEAGIILLGEARHLKAGMQVRRTGKLASVPVGKELLGRVVNPLGLPLDGLGELHLSERLPIERPAPPIIKRSPVKVPLQTGIKVIDALIPIGRGQRELILGDRQTGKSSIALDTILNQKNKNVLCIYCAIGQHASSVAQVIAVLRESGALSYTIVVVSEGSEAPGLHYIAPYAATSMGEYFMEQGKDVLIVYDDLINHARAYRELSLLLRRPPGREAFPGDIFYIHSRLLERATHLKEEYGGGSLTALPLVETEAQNMAAYIPTNLISITDGQIYLSPTLFSLGILPAVDVGRSVSRVGGKAQLSPYRSITGHLKLAYSQFEELETFARFGTRLDAHTESVIEHGRRLRSCLKQNLRESYSALEQVVVLLSLNHKLFEKTPLLKMKEQERRLKEKTQELPSELVEKFYRGDELSSEDQGLILALAREVLGHE